MADENSLGGKVELDITDFKANISALNREIRVIESGFKATAAGLGDWGASAEGLQSRIQSLTAVTETQAKKVENLKEIYKKIVAEKGEDSKAAQELQIKINQETAALNKNQKELQDTTDKLNKFGKETKDADDKTSKFSSTLASIGGGIAKGAVVGITALATAMGAAAVGAFKLAEKASDLSESQNVVKETFKQSKDEILKWTDTISKSAGISKSNATQFVGSMGAMLKSSGLTEKAAGDMAKQLVQLTGDMSSFYNLEHQEAWDKIRAGVSGETEPLKALGINMSVANLEAYALSKGINTAFSEMSQAEQTTLRYNYLLGVTKDAQGDFGRTLEGSFSNQLRVAKMNLEEMATSIGQTFLPSFLGIVQAINQGFKTGDWAGVATTLSTQITNVLNQITSQFPAILTVAQSLITGLATALVTAIPLILPAVVTTIFKLIDMLITVLTQNGPKLLQTGIDVCLKIIDGVVTALPKLIPLAVTLILALVNGIVAALPGLIKAAVDIILTLVNGIVAALPTLIQAMPKVITAVMTGIANSLPMLIDSAIKIIITLATAIIENLPIIIQAAIEIVGAIASTLINNLPMILAQIPKIFKAMYEAFKVLNLRSIGEAIIEGITSGVTSAAQKLIDAVVATARAALAATKSFLGIRSPSTVMKEQVGEMIGAGMAEGITDSQKQVNKAMSGLSNQLVGNAELNMSANAVAGRAGAVSGITLQIINQGTLVGTNGMSEFADVVSQKISNKLGFSVGGAF